MKTTEELAREAGFLLVRYDLSIDPPKRVAEGHLEALERFRDLVRNEALEEASQEAETRWVGVASAIRALKKDL